MNAERATVTPITNSLPSVTYWFQTSVRLIGAESAGFCAMVAAVNGCGRTPVAVGSSARMAATSVCSLFHSSVTSLAMPALSKRKSRVYSGLAPLPEM